MKRITTDAGRTALAAVAAGEQRDVLARWQTVEGPLAGAGLDGAATDERQTHAKRASVGREVRHETKRFGWARRWHGVQRDRPDLH